MRFQRKIFNKLKYKLCFVVSEPANCNNIKCKDRQVCLNDLITHRPRCVSCSFKCPRRQRPQVNFNFVSMQLAFRLFNQFFFYFNFYCDCNSDKIHIPFVQCGHSCAVKIHSFYLTARFLRTSQPIVFSTMSDRGPSEKLLHIETIASNIFIHFSLQIVIGNFSIAYEHDSCFTSDDISINVSNAISIRTVTYSHAIFDEENLILIIMTWVSS